MSLTNRYLKAKDLHSLIKQENTGSPEEASKKIGLKRSTLYEYIKGLKKMGAEVGYSRLRETFYYKDDFELPI